MSYNSNKKSLPLIEWGKGNTFPIITFKGEYILTKFPPKNVSTNLSFFFTILQNFFHNPIQSYKHFFHNPIQSYKHYYRQVIDTTRVDYSLHPCYAGVYIIHFEKRGDVDVDVQLFR